MTDVITLTVAEEAVLTVVGAPEVLTFFEQSAPEVFHVVDPASDHGRLVGLTDDDHTQYVKYVISVERPAIARPGTMWIPAGE